MTSLDQRKAILNNLGVQITHSDEELVAIPEEKFQAGIAKLQPDTSSVINEYHPDIPVSVRAAIKAFGSEGGNRSLEYARQHVPQLQWVQKDGDLLAKKPEETSWRRVDPSSITIPELARDALDLGYDIPAAAISAIPIAALGPYGIPVSAALGGGLEHLRQYVGKRLGVRGEYSPLETALSAAAPVIPKALSYGVQKSISPVASVASYMSDVPKEALQAYASEGFQKAASALRGSEQKMYETLASIGKPVMEAAQTAKQRAAAGIENVLRTADEYVPQGISTSSLLKRLNGFIASEKTPKGTTGTVAGDAELDSLKSFFEKQLSATPTEIPAPPADTILGKVKEFFTGPKPPIQVPPTSTNLSGVQLHALQRRLDSLAKGVDNLTGKPVEDQRVKVLAADLSKEVKNLQDKLWYEIPTSAKEKVGYESLAKARDEYANAVRQESIVNHYFGKTAKPYTKFNRSYKASEAMAGEATPIGYTQLTGIMQDLGVEPNQTQLNKLIAASSIEGRPLIEIPSGKSVVKFGGGPAVLGGAVGGYPGALTGGVLGTTFDTLASSPVLMSRLIQAMGTTSRKLGTRKASGISSMLIDTTKGEEL